MSHNSYEIHQWHCSIPDCDNTLTGSTIEHSDKNGWANETIFGENFDFCSECTSDLKSFLFGTEENDKPDTGTTASA